MEHGPLVCPLELQATAGSVRLGDSPQLVCRTTLSWPFQPNPGLAAVLSGQAEAVSPEALVRSPMSCCEQRFLLLGAEIPILPSLSRDSSLSGPFPVGFL